MAEFGDSRRANGSSFEGFHPLIADSAFDIASAVIATAEPVVNSRLVAMPKENEVPLVLTAPKTAKARARTQSNDTKGN